MENLEQWRQFIDTDYEVSSYGKVKSYKNKKITLLKPGVDKDGYFRVDICHNNTVRHYHIHRLVALCFVINPENLPQVNHKDTIKQNNYFRNLEWCTAKYNAVHASLNGLLSKNRKGENHKGTVKLTERIVLDIRDSKEDAYALAPKYNVSPATIYDIRKRRSWLHI